MRICIRSLVLLLVLSSCLSEVRADMVFPARLELIESEPGLFDVQFNLPVQNQARLKATPILPSVCVPLGKPEILFTPAAYRVTWQVNCAANELPGQTIGVDGLLGSSIDVLLSIKTRDGRQYNTVLKPARATFEIPPPPSLIDLTRTALIDGLRGSFIRVDLLLLIWLIVLVGRPHRETIIALLAGGVAFAVAQALARENLLLLPASLPAVLTLLAGVYFGWRLASGGEKREKLRFPLWLAGTCLGALYGGALPGLQVAPDFSFIEQRVAFLAYAIGLLAGLFILYLLCVEIKRVLQMIPGLKDDVRERRILGTGTGAAALGLLLVQLSAFSLLPTLLPTAPPILFVMAIILGVTVGRTESDGPFPGVTAALFFVLGLTIGTMGVRLPGGAVVGPLILFALGFGLATRQDLPRRAALVVIALAALYPAAQTGFFIQENLSRPLAQVAGNGILAAALFLAGFSVPGLRRFRFSPGIRLAGGIAAAVALLAWGQAYGAWLNTTFAADYAMGFIRIPLLSLVLVLLALIAWPRRSRVTAHLGTDVRRPLGHVVLLVLAVFLLNIGTLRARNPAFVRDAPGPEQARRILESVLANTYSAFNLKDEEALYRQLTESVGDDLVEDLYLDSRRRLTSGVRQGAEVTVQDVRVLNVGEPLKNTGDLDAFAYGCEWVVVARVRHLQHVHHRENRYTGRLQIRVDDGQWKIEQVDLESEERAIVSGRPT